MECAKVDEWVSIVEDDQLNYLNLKNSENITHPPFGAHHAQLGTGIQLRPRLDILRQQGLQNGVTDSVAEPGRPTDGARWTLGNWERNWELWGNMCQWIGLRENLNRKLWFLPSNIGLSCKFSHHPVL